MTTYPVSLTLTGRRVLVVGGGRVATRRVEELLEAGARLDVVAPAVSGEIAAWAEAGRLQVAHRPFEAGMLFSAKLRSAGARRQAAPLSPARCS